MIVTLRAANGQAQPGDAGGGDAIDDVEIAILGVDESAFVAGHVVAMETAGDLLLHRGLGQQVSRELSDGEFTERHVRVEGFDHPLAPEPHVAK